MREDPYHSLDDADIDPASSESIDLFEYFADAAEHTSARRGMRMKKVGLLACLEFLGYLQPQAKGRVPVLTSARRVTPMEALDVFDSVLDCTSISDDEDEEEHIGDTNKTGSRGLTEEQFEAVLHVLDLRIRRSEASFHPFSAAVTGSDSIGNMLRTSPRTSLSPRQRSQSPHRSSPTGLERHGNVQGTLRGSGDVPHNNKIFTDSSPQDEQGAESTSETLYPDSSTVESGGSPGSPNVALTPMQKGQALVHKDVPSVEHFRGRRPVLE